MTANNDDTIPQKNNSNIDKEADLDSTLTVGINRTYSSTPMSLAPNVANTLTVTRKARTRQQTVTVESQVSKEVNTIFDDVQKMSDLNNPNEELRRRIQRFFLEKEKEYVYKISEMEKNREEELALTKIKLSVALKTISKVEDFFKVYNHSTSDNTFSTHKNCNKNVLSPVNGDISVLNAGGHGTPGADTSLKIASGAYADLVKERNMLRDELRELENSYSDLFKRYEKMRENCVLLKNAEETLKRNAEDDAAKYEKLAGMYAELRNTAANELHKANVELVRVEKQHEENTLNMRCRLKRNESEINALTMTIQGKNTQLEELNNLCDDLMRKNGVVDEEAMSIADSYDNYS